MRWYHFFTYDGWVWVTALVFGVVYWYAHLSLLEEKVEYESMKSKIEQKKIAAIVERDELKSTLAHADDAGWVEWNLMYYLGLTPKGSVKVIFKDSKD